MTTDILIPLGKGSRHDDIELRYCLRSIEKHLTGVGNVIIVGDYPPWLQNVIFIPYADNPNSWMRANNIFRKISVGMNFTTENFLFMNDDHFLLEDYEAAKFPNYFRGTIKLQDIKDNNPQYRQMENTIHQNCILDFDIHCPIIYHKTKFTEIFSGLSWPAYGFGIKSMYGNTLFDSDCTLCADLKFTEPLFKESICQVLGSGHHWFSISDRSLKGGGMLEVLEELYPHKSKFEM